MTNKKRGTISIVIICILIVFCIVPATGSGAAAGATASVPDNPGAGQGLVGWQSQDIDGTAKYGRYFELAVDTNGKPHIAATQSRDEFTSSLVYFTRERGVWKKEVVDDQSAVLNDPQITTDLFGQPHIVYGYLIDGFSANYALKYAYKDRFGWHIENLTDTLGQTYGSVSIAVNRRGSPRIAYIGYPGAGLMYASRRTGRFSALTGTGSQGSSIPISPHTTSGRSGMPPGTGAPGISSSWTRTTRDRTMIWNSTFLAPRISPSRDIPRAAQEPRWCT
jgi:hypothetical protein